MHYEVCCFWRFSKKSLHYQHMESSKIDACMHGIVNLLGSIGGTIGFLGIGFVLDTVGFVYPFIMRAIAYIVAALLIYFKLKD